MDSIHAGKIHRPQQGRMNHGARVRVPENTELASLLRRLVLDGVEVNGFFKVERRLEEAFVDMLRTKPPPLP